MRPSISILFSKSDTKPLVAAGYWHETGKALRHTAFSGGAQVEAVFRRLARSIDAIPSISREGLFLGLFAQRVQCIPSRCLSVKAGRRCPWKNIGSALGIQIEIYAQINVVRIARRECAKDGWYERGRKRVVAATHDA